MEFEKLDDWSLSDKKLVKVTEMGNVTELMYMSHKNFKATIKKLSKNQFVILSTGEKKEFIHTENRAQGKNALRITLRKLRNLLNANITDTTKCRWITLTYAENMQDTERLYEDFRKFNMRLKYHFKKLGVAYEYIVAMEPQGRGAWHCHLVLIFDDVAPYIPNDELASIWGFGFVTVKRLDDVDNVGAYLTAYLGDMDVEDALEERLDIVSGNVVKEVQYTDEEGTQKSKYYIKGARLNLYPPGFNLYRCSRGVKKPVEYEDININATKKASAGTLTYRSTHQLTTDDGFNTIIDKRYYNSRRDSSQTYEKAAIVESDKPKIKINRHMLKSDYDNLRDIRKAELNYTSGFIPNCDHETGELYATPFDE